MKYGEGKKTSKIKNQKSEFLNKKTDTGGTHKMRKKMVSATLAAQVAQRLHGLFGQHLGAGR